MNIRKIQQLIFPGGLLCAVAYFLPHSRYWIDIESIHIDIIGGVTLVFGLLLAWRFDRSRLVYTLLLLATVDGLDRWFLLPEQSNTIHSLLAVMLPLNFLLAALFREKGIGNRYSHLKMTLLPTQVAAGIYLIIHGTGSVQGLLRQSHFPAPLNAVPDIHLVAILLAFAVLTYRYLRYGTTLDIAFLWALLAATASTIIPPGPEATLLRLAAALILILALFEMSYTLAYRDELTGVASRRALNDASRKLGSCYSVAMADIDHFKKLNDSYGHDVGDQVLRMVASRLSTCRTGGRLYRYGGEEFCIIFNGRSIQDAAAELERLRKAIADEPFLVRKLSRPLKKPKNNRSAGKTRQSIRVTISIGVATRDERKRRFDDVLKSADQALYRAKKGGRNQVRA